MSWDNATIKRVQDINWYHRIDFGDGLISKGVSNSQKRLPRLKLPLSFTGKSVLDIGCWDGFHAFDAEKRGASRVLATDSYMWSQPNGKAGFDCAKELLKSKVEERMIDPMDLSERAIGQFDIVLFLGVLYHLRDPMLALENIASVTKEMIVLETLVDMLCTSRPALAFYPEDSLCGDSTNWFGPNPAAVVEMLKAVGFKNVQMVTAPRSFLYRVAFAWHIKRQTNANFFTTIHTDRAVFHAWK